MNGMLANEALRARPTLSRATIRWSSDRKTAWAVIALTVFGGVARFATSARIPLWNDEAHTFRRVSGTFGQLNAILSHDAFPPLHYYAYWMLAQALGGAGHLTPFWMRFIPCLAGTLMIPAMYWLAAELSGRPTALLTAAFTCVSAFLMAYSHDAKMYMPLWLFCALSMASCLWWLRSKSVVAWSMWVATSVIMVGLHASGLAVLALQPLVVLTWAAPAPRHIIGLIVGLAIIAAGPAFYYVSVNHWVHNSEQVGWNRASGLHWVAEYNQGRGNVSRVLYLTSAYLCGWEWPPSRAGANDAGPTGIGSNDGIPVWLTPTLGAVVVAILLAGAAGAGIGIRRGGHSKAQALPVAAWRSALWLGVWLVVPLYAAFRLSSIPADKAGTTGGPEVLALAGGIMFLAAAGVILYLARNPLKELCDRILNWSSSETRNGLGVIVAIPLIAMLVGYAVQIAAGHPDEPSSVWVPRYLGLVWPAFAIVLCSMLLRLPGRALPATAGGLLLLVNIAVSAATIGVATEPPVDRMVSDLLARGEATRVYMPAHPPSSPAPGGGCVFNAVGRYYLSIARGNPFGPRGFDNVPIDEFVPTYSADDSLAIAADLKGDPRTRHVIVWEQPTAASSGDDSLPHRLGPGWRSVSDELIPVRYHWNWSKLYDCRRREYERS